LNNFAKLTLCRAESCHAYLKRWLGGKKTKGDLLTTWTAIELAVNLQIKNITRTTNLSRDKVPLNIDRKLYQGTFGVITWYTLQRVQQHRDTFDASKPCTGTFTRSMGLPCAHLCNKQMGTYGLVPTDFSTHWYWDGSNTIPPLIEPRTIIRNRSGQIIHTAPNTSRELSGFEREDLGLPVRSAMKCSGYNGLGHNRRSKQCPINMQALIATTSHQLHQSEQFQQEIRRSIPNVPDPFASLPSSQLSASNLLGSPASGFSRPIMAAESIRNNDMQGTTSHNKPGTPIRYSVSPPRYETPDQ
jgi:hypothetical protein